jgi:hypothetical protein
MSRMQRLVVLSDIHHAGPGEQARRGHEAKVVGNPLLRLALTTYRRYLWLHDPQSHNHMLDRFLAEAPVADLAVANGDYSCDTGFVGLADDAALESARLGLAPLRERFGDALELTWGDHELGKFSLLGGAGGLRMASWRRGLDDLGLKPLWRRDVGRYVLLGVVSSVVALPVYGPEALPEELPEWEALRRDHLAAIRGVFENLEPDQRVLLFCHDPTALPFLHAEPAVSDRFDQIETTIIGHLHTKLVLWQSRLLAGMPRITFLGNAVRRMSTALQSARRWRPFKVRLCPSLTGCQLLKDGGFLAGEIDPEARLPAAWRFHPLRW